jgi:hypothetical protein
MSRTQLRRRITEILTAHDPTAAPSAGIRRRAESIRAAQRVQQASHQAEAILESHPEIADAVRALEKTAKHSAEETEALEWILRILTGNL